MIDILFKVRELVDKATNIVMNYTETEAKVMLLNTHKKYQKNIAFFQKGSRGNKWRPLGSERSPDARNRLLHIRLRGFPWGGGHAVEAAVAR